MYLPHETNNSAVTVSEDSSESEPHLVSSHLVDSEVIILPTTVQAPTKQTFHHLRQAQEDQVQAGQPNLQLVAQAVTLQNKIVHAQSSEAWQIDVSSISGSPLGLGVMAGTFGLCLTYLGIRLRTLDIRLSRYKSKTGQKSQIPSKDNHYKRLFPKRNYLKNAYSDRDLLTGFLSRAQLVAVGERFLSNVLSPASKRRVNQLFSEQPLGLVSASHAEASHSAKRLSLLCVNVNKFSAINTELGYEFGDELLSKLSRRLRSALRSQHLPSAILARIGSDEFALLIANVDDYVVRRVSQDVLKVLSKPIVIQGHSLSVSYRMGAASANVSELARFSDLLSRASMAMGEAKPQTAAAVAASTVLSQPTHAHWGNADQVSASQVVFFEPKIEKQARSRLAFEKALSQAISRQQFRIHYQPIVDLNTTALNTTEQAESHMRDSAAVQFKTVGFEALIRWQHPEQGLLQPAQFLPVAEKMGLMVQVDRWVMESVCKQLAAWQQSCLVVNVNLSANHLTQPDLVDYIKRLLRYYPVSPQQLNLEITEGELISDLDRAIAVLHQIRALGLTISLDDFGTGYSSLNYLGRLPADVIKIDQSFIRRMHTSTQEKNGELPPSQSQQHQAKTPQIIVKTILELAAELNLRVVAEGIEQVEQLELLKKMHCGYGQGYLFSRPTNAQLAKTLI